MKSSSLLLDQLEELYSRYNRRVFVHPDPLEFLYRYSDVRNREIAGLVASSLAYGRVAMILKSTETVLGILGVEPSSYLQLTEPAETADALAGFKHRFTCGMEISSFLVALSSIQREYGSVGEFFGYLMKQRQYIDALDAFSSRVTALMGVDSSHLLPRPSRGSACKRLHLFMRWMVREDDVDPGGWDMISPADLVVPVDVHMHRMGTHLGFTKRKSADGKTAREITDGFRLLSASDPVKYDFTLTRYGIQGITECELFRNLLS